jgi:hypothetical protein
MLAWACQPASPMQSSFTGRTRPVWVNAAAVTRSLGALLAFFTHEILAETAAAGFPEGSEPPFSFSWGCAQSSR